MCAANVLFKLSGSIAAWKACAVISRLVQDGYAVQTVATQSALKFIGAATLEGLTGRAVKSDLWEPGTAMDHINLVKWADLVVLCPATASTINRLAAGLGDDIVSTLFLAHDWKKPYLIAPAMNPAMFAHPATQAGLETLRGWGVRVLPVARGRMACGDEGEGRLLEPEAIVEAIVAALPTRHGATSAIPATNGTEPRLRILVTAGGTEEPVDGVRTLTNFSTGRTGAMLAESLQAAGYEVTLLRSQRATAAGGGVRTETFATFGDLSDALQRLLGAESFDAIVHAAAVSDYSVAGLTVNGVEMRGGAGKVGSGQDVSIRLTPNPKLIDSLRSWSRNPDLRVIAFKLTRGADAAAARAAVESLFAHSHADAVVHNDLESIDPETGRFPAEICRIDGTREAVDSREALAAALVRLIGEKAVVAANGTGRK